MIRYMIYKTKGASYLCDVKHCESSEPKLTDSITLALFTSYTRLTDAFEVLIGEFFVVVNDQGGTGGEFLH